VEVYHRNFFVAYIKTYFEDKKSIKKVKEIIKKSNLSRNEYKKIIHLLKNEISLNRKIDRLTTMQNLLKYWHVAHLPFAFIMLIVMIVHVVIAIVFGAKWIL
jgi:mRNA-degrading endonuclease YafQ of YafQ-DinJ toxin-antitoxin module